MNVGVEVVDQRFEFPFQNEHFEKLRGLVFEHTGITLGNEKKQLTYSRYSKRLRALGITDFNDYIDIIRSGDESEIPMFVSAITTNFTSFFRENHHFEFLVEEVARLLKTKQSIRIWSAGCSSGEEPYSMAMSLLHAIPGVETADVRILATDLDTEILAKAARGVYTDERFDGADKQIISPWIKRGRGDNTGLVLMHPAVRKMITYRQLNLLGPWPMKSPFDIIFCRNVVIYFSKDVQKTLFNRFSANQQKGAKLMIGHSENLAGVCDSYRLIGRTIYEKM
ncbi:CheR family methyltransferase [Zhongshania aquimaris]|uniref:Chemotaxis protein methyltransferase n=1 Tax=Zhongshania aquimaris TaxID=2857107 RepID=A0ABS6VU57_9GAMM|nr:protein-glutamate O-methyltransferase CheR [Zhongshania aquimaris]MBW2941863.1 protein-glutamate O-methyltransferase CheR [Zhongshania aquimaris]